MYIYLLFFHFFFFKYLRGRRGVDRMVVGFTTTNAISAYHIIYDEILTFIQAVVLLNWPPFHGMFKLNIYVARMFLSKNEIIKLAKTN
jgi:uncharacterized membrane protein HdeD (DUF308 family)